MKKIIYSLTLIFCGLIFYPQAYAFTSCVNNGSSTSAAITETSDCYTQPDIQKVTFYRIALCTGQPSAPSTTTAIGTSSCTNVFYNSSGSSTTITYGSLTGLTGNTALTNDRLILPTGTYKYIYVEVSPSFQQQKTAYFNTTITNSDSTSTGVKCWSLAATGYSYFYGTFAMTTCGASGDTATDLGITTSSINSLYGASGLVYSLSYSCDSPASSINAYLLTSGGLLASSAAVNSLGDIAKIAGYTAISDGITVSSSNQQNISSLVFGFLNTQGTGLSLSGGTLYQFTPGPFCIYLKSYSM